MKKVAIIMGSDSDWPVVKGACAVLKDFGVPYEAHILSAHRTPEAAAAFARSARAEGYGVILCAAGMAAHLAGAFAANTTLPVIGIPMKGGAMDGLDALLATVQMPSGIPVATVALNGAKNAAWLAAEILALGNTGNPIGISINVYHNTVTGNGICTGKKYIRIIRCHQAFSW